MNRLDANSSVLRIQQWKAILQSNNFSLVIFERGNQFPIREMVWDQCSSVSSPCLPSVVHKKNKHPGQ